MVTKADRRRALERQVTRVEHRLNDLNRVAGRLAWSRLVIFVIGLVTSIAVWAVAGPWLALPMAVIGLVAYSGVAQVHSRLKDAVARFDLWRTIKQTHVARMSLDWEGLPPPLAAVPRPDRPVELDLDLTGERALHRLLDTCVSREGSQRLRDWLVTTDPDPDQSVQRQVLVRELVPLAVFRDKLHLYARLVSRGHFRRWDGARVQQWLEHLPPGQNLDGWRQGLTALALTNIVLFFLSLLTPFPAVWRVTLAVYALLYLWRAQQLGGLFKTAFALSDPLQDLKAVFEYLESYRYGPALRSLCAPFLDSEHRPSVHLRRVTRVLGAASVRHNPYFWLMLSLVVPWDLYVAHWLERRRVALVALLPQWLDVWFELEALCALANLGYLNPAYTFPVLTPVGARPVFEARALGHPLIPDDERICNDFTLGQPGNMALITGSNMSGKSTFLRTLGINLCLTYAGSPVNAEMLCTVPLRLFTCIRVTDSVTDGISYFYAEVKRLKALLTALETDQRFPLCFLIDEIFRGTNNRERLIGSRAYIRTLVTYQGVGVLSTHDLELVQLADEIPSITNYHFEETIAGGRMSFDYRLRAGPSPTTNALKIMAMEGLPVTEAEESPRPVPPPA
jgi:hypothetical protein